MTFIVIEGQIARQIYEKMRQQAASLRIQTYYRMYHARKAYRVLSFASINIQAGIRGMAARKELLFRRQTRAAIVIQVNEPLSEYSTVFHNLFL